MNSRIIKSQFVQLGATHGGNTARAGHGFRPSSSGGTGGTDDRERAHAGKSARLIEDAGRVCAIEVTCDCGEATLVELAFASETQDAAQHAVPEVVGGKAA